MSWKVVISALAVGLVALGTTYQANGTAPVMAYVANVSLATGSYLVGLFQLRPGDV